MIKLNRSNRHWNRSQRRRYHDNDFDIQFDWNRPLNQSCYVILYHIISKDSIQNKNKLLAYLNLFTKYCLYRYGKLDISEQAKLANINGQSSSETTSSFLCDTEILCCLRVGLFNDVAEVRAASLRAIRYFVQNKKTLHNLIEINLHHLIARSLDIVLENRVERVQAMRLLRHLMAIEPNLFPIALGRCLCSIANDNYSEKDTLLRVCWATISELTILNAIISARSGCINILVRCALNAITGLNLSEYDGDLSGGKNNRNITNNPNNLVMSSGNGIFTNFTIPFTNIALSEAIISSFLYLYNYPETRRLVHPNGSDLFYFISPFTDLYSFFHASTAAQEQQNLNAIQLDNQDDPHHPHHAHEDGQKFPFDFFDVHKENKAGQKNKNQAQQSSQQTNASYEQRTLRYLSCKNAILSILRSWPGCFFMCRVVKMNKFYPNNNKLEFNSEWVNMSRKLARIFFEEKLPVDDDDSTSTINGYDTLNPLESLISLLHLPYTEIHGHILELLYELFGLKLPECSEDFDEAIRCVYFNYQTRQQTSRMTIQSNKNYLPDEWQLYDGFVAKEAEDILPSLAGGRLNFIINHQALLLQSLIEFGILEALLNVILESNDRPTVNLSTIMLGELLHLSGKYLPQSSYAHRCQSLPTLVAASVSNSRERRNRALMTITMLNRIQDIKKQGPQPTSLFLEQQIFFYSSPSNPSPSSNILVGRKKSGSISKMQDENVLLSIKNSNVLRKSSFRDWNWDLIIDILKQPYDIMLKLEDKEVRSFCSRLLEFYLPSKRQFSAISKNSGLSSTTEMTTTSPTTLKMTHGHNEVLYSDNPRQICLAAIYFIDFLLQADENHASDYLNEFIHDLDRCLKNIANKVPSSDEIFIPSRLLSTLSQKYFLLLGRFTHNRSGRNWLKKTHIYQNLIDLINIWTNEIYAKLIISSFDYSETDFPRNILSKVLTSSNETTRIYSTKFLRLLLRINVTDFAQWGIDLLINQLYDQSSVISLEALDILDEACADNTNYLKKVLEHRPALQNLGDKGIVFFARFASFPIGINMLIQTNTLDRELDRWRNHFHLRYVRLVEDCLNECFTCHQKSVTGKYGRRPDRRNFSQLRSSSMTAHLVPHFYGQLAKTYEGLQIIIEHSLCEEMLAIIHTQINRFIVINKLQQNDDDVINKNENRDNSEYNILRMKAALWAIGHIGSTDIGLEYLIKCNTNILKLITTLVERSTILSIRATGFYVICLFASTLRGADELACFGWSAIKHSHYDCFPIDQQHFENFHLFPVRNQPKELNDSSTTTTTVVPKSIVSIPSGYFSLFVDNDNSPNNLLLSSQNTNNTNPLMNSNQACQFSISSYSSSSSSSSYLSILPTTGQHPSNKLIRINGKSMEKLLKPDMTSNTSNTSSIASLSIINPYNTITTNNNRLRSSSDCNSSANNNNQLFDSKKTKPESQDSGILNHSNDGLNRSNLISPERNRKISAPCFPISSLIMINDDDKIRHDSYESAQTNNSESCSASFTEYSTTSSQSNTLVHHRTFESNNVQNESNSLSSQSITAKSSTLPTTPVPINNNNNRIITNQLISNSMDNSSNNRQQTPIVIVNGDDPYPSPMDAYGYAQLIAIQKCRVQSLSGNGFFSFSSSNFSNSIPDSFPKSIDSVNTDTFSMDLFQSKNSSNETFQKSSNTNRIQIQSPVQSMMNANSNQQNKLIINQLSVNDTIQGGVNTKQRSLSNDSQISGQSEFEMTTGINFQQTDEKSNFMCLCLPQNLSLIFHLEETNKPKAKERLKTSDQLNNVHNAAKCLLCCKDFGIEITNNNHLYSSSNNEPSSEVEQKSDSEMIDNVNDLEVHRDEVLRLVSNLSVAIYSKQSEQGLLSLKQKYPKIFENFCLYSDVCLQMERNNYKITARRFLHELFMDINVNQFYQHAEAIMRKYEHLKPIES
uniref:Rapamycin-insensitive companion of mTOR-like isoform X2 n=1 Tax=Dermatophagoides pteronyssinus TaxID=6956 RepID=A0A6P6Y1S7_DERPT|nr:rapamycin-insensitive companion of mTOR-like isoform X2 [Dermatophagoides pteronyssinus]